MSDSSQQYDTTFVWQAVDEKLGEEIIDFWQRHRALPSVEASKKRLPEVAMIVRDSENVLVAVSSVQSRNIEQLGHACYSFRCFVDPEHRRSLLAARLIREVFEHFDARFREGAEPNVIGMVAEVENPALNREHNQAVWPHSGFVFVGYDRAGRHVRVRYFTGARIKSRI